MTSLQDTSSSSADQFHCFFFSAFWSWPTEFICPVSRKTTKHIHHPIMSRPETEDLPLRIPSPSHYPLAWLRTYLIQTFKERRVVMVSHHIDSAGVTNYFLNYPHRSLPDWERLNSLVIIFIGSERTTRSSARGKGRSFKHELWFANRYVRLKILSLLHCPFIDT